MLALSGVSVDAPESIIDGLGVLTQWPMPSTFCVAALFFLLRRRRSRFPANKGESHEESQVHLMSSYFIFAGLLMFILLQKWDTLSKLELEVRKNILLEEVGRCGTSI